MSRIKKNLILNLPKDLKGFLRLDMGVGRHVPDEQKIDAERRLTRKLQRERRGPDEGKPRQPQNQSDDPVTSRRTHALPQPDESINRRQIFRSLISPLKPGTMLDMGTGPGTFALAAAELGWEVTAVDARTMRMPDPETEKDPGRAKLIRSIRWVEADVREFPIRSGEYDLICVLGILHHLRVNEHVELLKRCSDTLTLLDTRIAPEITVTEGPYEGRYHHEPGKTREERDQVPTASWGNEASFHHTEESLLRLARDCGYSKVMPMRPPHDRNYTFYLCLPSPPR